MPHLADTNILLRRIDRGHATQAEAAAALRTLLRSDDLVYVTSQNMMEFWNVCTRPVDRNGLGLSPGEADREASRLEGLLTFLPETPAIYLEWRRIVVAHSVSVARVHDAHIVAAMNVYGVTNLLTFNGPDFDRYREIRVVHPNDVASR